jgi:hypothetical protein
MTDAPRPPRLIARGATCLAPMAIVLALTSTGCDQAPLHSEQGSPVVSADSEAGKKALAESQKFLDLRKQQEARAGRRGRRIPADPG